MEKKSIPIRIGISACVMGEKVRFDGQHKRDRYVMDVLGQYFSFIPVCPEVEVGMGVPRESVRLVGTPEDARMIAGKSGKDWTDKMKRFITKRLRQLEDYKMSGYILKKDSPSCGMERVKVYTDKGMPSKQGRGFWGGGLVDHFPLLPVEEEGRMNDHKLRENFIVRVFAYNRLLNLFDGRFSRNEVVEFHTAHKYLLMAHSPKHYKQLGQLAAAVKKFKPSEFRDRYSSLFMECLKTKASVKKNVNVLQHIMGYLKDHIGGAEKGDILDVIENYRGNLLPLVVPLTLINHYIKKYNIEYISNQHYISPHPKELMLRNHV
ncbi:MAG: DUF1722 domain-containing protein [candidate division Zixibacteria bacterium]|nr:DUF1722 domain-containing protein [candidate division Zixibacteria bacterium]